MPLLVDAARAGSSELYPANCVTVGLINNMPDSAFAATERQLIDLMREAARNCVVRLLLFAIPEVPRGDDTARELAERYRDAGELWDTRLDGLIVTGNEPRAKNIKDEPYWRPLARVVDWSRRHTTSTIWSCLAAHAAVLHCDGIERRPLKEKCFGVFECEAAGAHPMLRNVALPLYVPHSRCNDLPERALTSAGYRIVTRSAEAGVDMFAWHDRSFHLFLQGHPEYEAVTLLREYRRDIGRYLRGERDEYPAIPQNYFDAAGAAAVAAFRRHAQAERRIELISRFPRRALEAGLENRWRDAAIGIYENWFEYLKGRKAERRPPHLPMRRVWRDWPGSPARPAAASYTSRNNS